MSPSRLFITLFFMSNVIYLLQAGRMENLKSRITSTKSIAKTTKNMAKIANTQFTTAEARFNKLDAELQELNAQISSIDKREKTHSGSGRKVLYIILGSNKGLCGNFNTALMRQVQTTIEKSIENKEFVTLLFLGEKIRSGLRRWAEANNLETIEDFVKYNFDGGDLDFIRKITNNWETIISLEEFAKYILKEFNDGKYTDIILFRNKYEKYDTPMVSPVMEKFLPLGIEYLSDQYIKDLIPQIVTKKIYAAMAESTTGRLIRTQAAMATAHINADDMVDKFSEQYNRMRQYQESEQNE